MAMYGLLSAPALGMLAQSSAFGTISQNIMNINTGGYRSELTRFETVLGQTFDNNSDIGGLQAYRVNNVKQQGEFRATTNSRDVAINGQGLFAVNTKLDGSGETLYTRDGAFELLTSGTEAITGNLRDDGSIDTSGNGAGPAINFTIDKAFLTDKNGNFVQGWPADETGAVNITANPTSMRVDNFGFLSDSSATTTASLALRLPASASVGQVETAKASVNVATGTLNTLEFVWTRTATPQQWTLTISPINGTSTSTETFTFGTDSLLAAGTTTPVAITWNDGQTSTITLDVSDVRSVGTNFFYSSFEKNGRGPGDLESFTFDLEGFVNGKFTNGVVRPLYRLPLATFTNADGLENRQGNTFEETVASGQATLRAASVSGFAQFIPFSHELSNVNLGTEFNNMILVQQAYNSAATVFKTVDEMTSVAADLKS